MVVIRPGGEESVYAESRHVRAALGVLLASICTAATTCSQAIPAFSHFEAPSDRIFTDFPARNCMWRPQNLGFLGTDEVALVFSGAGVVKAAFSQFGGLGGGCESDLTGLPAKRASQSAPERENSCFPTLKAVPGASRNPGCARTIESAEREDPVAEQLSLLGKAGTRVAQARAEVLGILDSENACRAWFETKDAAPADTFRSLTYSIDRRGPQDISQWETEARMLIWHQPWVAQAVQNSGSNTAITINANGAFFRTLGNVEKIALEGGPAQKGEPRWLLVGPYGGSSAEAEIVTLLHEFGHIIDLLPPDADNLDGKSVRNTDEVLRHCKTEIEAHGKHLKETAHK